MKKVIAGLVLALFFMLGCSREEVSVQVVRNPLIKFEYDSLTWKAANYDFIGPSRVVIYPADPNLPGVLYNRFTLQATGTDNQGNTLQLQLLFDAVDSNRLTGFYHVNYQNQKGLSDITLFRLGTNPAAYHLCEGDSLTPELHIQKQSQEEKLVTGSFKATLCDSRDTSQKIMIRNGVINDIRY